jgi:hypothetical protein
MRGAFESTDDGEASDSVSHVEEASFANFLKTGNIGRSGEVSDHCVAQISSTEQDTEITTVNDANT